MYGHSESCSPMDWEPIPPTTSTTNLMAETSFDSSQRHSFKRQHSSDSDGEQQGKRYKYGTPLEDDADGKKPRAPRGSRKVLNDVGNVYKQLPVDQKPVFREFLIGELKKIDEVEEKKGTKKPSKTKKKVSKIEKNGGEKKMSLKKEK